MAIEPGTSPKHRYELIKATLLVIVGALITITIVYGIPYFSPKEVSDVTNESPTIITPQEVTTNELDTMNPSLTPGEITDELPTTDTTPMSSE
jgi:hypothetical protein